MRKILKIKNKILSIRQAQDNPELTEGSKMQRGLALSERRGSKGFTIVELLIYMGILSILLGILTSIFVSALDVQLESEANSSVEQDGNYILARLSYDIHRASAITIPNALGETTNVFQITVEGVNYLYDIDPDNNLVLANNLGINKLNGYDSSISNLSIQRLGNVGKIEDSINISFDITSRTRRNVGLQVKNFKTNLSLRRQ